MTRTPLPDVLGEASAVRLRRTIHAALAGIAALGAAAALVLLAPDAGGGAGTGGDEGGAVTIPLRSPAPAVVEALPVAPGRRVARGEVLVVLRPLPEEAP